MLKVREQSHPDQADDHQERYKSQGRKVRMVIVTWPVLALVGATVATAACLLNECEGRGNQASRQTFVGACGTVKTIAIRPDGAMLLSIEVDGSMGLFDLASPSTDEGAIAEFSNVRHGAFSADNRLLAIASSTTSVCVYDLAEDRARPLTDVAAASVGAACVSFSPDGRTLAVGQQDGRVTLWDVASGRLMSSLGGHSAFVAALAFAPDGLTLASAGGDGTARIWNLETNRQKLAIVSTQSTFAPDGLQLATGGFDGTVRLWAGPKATGK
jgi:WD40 repeat protein